LPVYVVCTKAPFEDVMRGLRLLAVEHGVESLLSVDIGRDGLLTSYESRLGSYRTDTLARATLASAVDRLGLKAAIAVAALRAEGGGALDLNELTATLIYLKDRGALLGVLQAPVGDYRFL
jgi:hypothetical protein